MSSVPASSRRRPRRGRPQSAQRSPAARPRPCLLARCPRAGRLRNRPGADTIAGRVPRIPRRGATLTTTPPVLFATGPFHGLPIQDAFALGAEAGFDGVEVMVTTDKATQDPHELGRLAARHSLEIRAVHGPFLLLTRHVFGTDPRLKVARSVELAEAVGAPLVVTHAPWRWATAYQEWLVEEVERVRAERGVTVTVENMFPVIVRGWRVAFHAGMELSALRRWPALTLDTSHLAVGGLDPCAAHRALGERVVHVHAANNAGNGRDTHARLEEGVAPVTRFLEQLGRTGYRGDVTLEVNFRPLMGRREHLLAAMRSELEIARRHLALGRRQATGAA